MEFQKNDIVTVTIEDIGNDGEGIGKVNGFTLFVKDVVPGDKVEARIVKNKRNYAYARLEEVVVPSPFRIEPECAYHRQCGGCQLQALAYDRQLIFKQEKIRNSLIRIGGFAPEYIDELMEPIVGMEAPFRYRNKAQYPVGTDRDGNVIAGFYAGRTHSIIANTDCRLGAEENEAVLNCLLEYMRRNRISAYDESTGTGLIRHVLIRKGFASGEIMVCLVINFKKKKPKAAGSGIERLSEAGLEKRRLSEAGLEKRRLSEEFLPRQDELIFALKKIKGMTSVSVSINTQQTNVIMGNEIHTIWGRETISDTIHMRDMRQKGYPHTGEELTFQISPLSFYQVNPIQTEKLYSLALEYAGLTGRETVWDLYCGIGTISLFLAGKAKRVCGAEVVAQAVEDARKNAERNGITNAEFFAGNAEELLREHCGDGRGEKADVIVVDPPRKGCDAACLDAILKAQPDRIVYVSCDPATLARDLKTLCHGGYELKKVRGVDQFGMTVHVETCVLLTHKKPTSFIEVTMDYEKIVPNQKPGKATYKMITNYVKEKYDLVVKSTTIADVKRSFGLEVGDYNVKDEKTNYRKEKITPEKRQAVEDALRHFGVIE